MCETATVLIIVGKNASGKKPFHITATAAAVGVVIMRGFPADASQAGQVGKRIIMISS